MFIITKQYCYRIVATDLLRAVLHNNIHEYFSGSIMIIIEKWKQNILYTNRLLRNVFFSVFVEKIVSRHGVLYICRGGSNDTFMEYHSFLFFFFLGEGLFLILIHNIINVISYIITIRWMLNDGECEWRTLCTYANKEV